MMGLTKRSRAVSVTILFLIVLSQVTSPGDATATLRVKMVLFSNPDSRDWIGQGCDFVFNPPCDNIFEFCLDNIGGNNDFGSGDCSYGLYRTGEFTNQDQIAFGSSMIGVANPIVRHLSSWQGVRLKVRVNDDDSSHSQYDLVDKYFRNLVAVANVNGTQPTVNRVSIQGERPSHHKTSLVVDFDVTCDTHFYGSDCTTYCKYSDDYSGHYRCTDQGQIECLNGWEDVAAKCTIRTDDCLGNQCQNGATCLDANRSYMCLCPTGYIGTHCETDVDECQSHPCLNNGTCVDGPGRFHCECPNTHPASLSPLCAVHTCLYQNPCQNGGSCYGAGHCLCPPNYTGQRCENHFCEANCVFCKNGGTCNGTSCLCPRGTLGERCEIRLCDVIQCLNGATCVAGVCVCAEGFTGLYCHVDLDDCHSSPCGNGGFCVDSVNDYSCQCQTGYTGERCDTQLTTSTTTTTTTAATTPKTTTTTTDKPKNPNVIDFQTNKPVAKPVTQEKSPHMFTIMIALLVLLVIVILILVAMLCRNTRKQKKAPASTPSTAANDNFENPVYALEGSRARPNVYDDTYVVPQGAVGGATDNSNYVNKGLEMMNESPYAQPPHGPARPVHPGDPIYDQPRPVAGYHPEPPPYSPTADNATYSNIVEPGVVRMNEIRARLQAEEQAYEELDVKRPLP